MNNITVYYTLTLLAYNATGSAVGVVSEWVGAVGL